ncbi:MAG: HEAT repeat domain-containing protein [Promethearchaeota archaeon]
MDKDLKDLIDTIEIETKTRAQLESQIKSMKEEINRLKFTIKEQHLLIEEQGDQISFAQSDLPSEINILKEMIASQRKDLIKRDENIERLYGKIDELTSHEEQDKYKSVESQNNELIEAQELILKFSEESEEYRNQIEDLKNQVESLKSEKSELEEAKKTPTDENAEIVNLKRLNFQLMEQNGLLRVEIESLKAKMQEKVEALKSEELELANKKIRELTTEMETLNIKLAEKPETVSIQELDLANKKIEDLTSELEVLKAQMEEKIESATSEELELANRKIEALSLEIDDYDAQLKFLQKELETQAEPAIISTEEALEYAKMRDQYENTKSELLKYQEENTLLKNYLSKLETQNNKLIDIKKSTKSIAYDFPEHFQISLFKRMYSLLDDNEKQVVINGLIKDLNNKNNQIRRTSIKLLSEIKDKRVYDTFLELIHDEDWLIRYNLIKALSKFDFESEEFRELLKNLLKDSDVDVRELAAKMLNEITK